MGCEFPTRRPSANTVWRIALPNRVFGALQLFQELFDSHHMLRKRRALGKSSIRISHSRALACVMRRIWCLRQCQHAHGRLTQIILAPGGMTFRTCSAIWETPGRTHQPAGGMFGQPSASSRCKPPKGKHVKPLLGLVNLSRNYCGQHGS